MSKRLLDLIILQRVYCTRYDCTKTLRSYPVDNFTRLCLWVGGCTPSHAISYDYDYKDVSWWRYIIIVIGGSISIFLGTEHFHNNIGKVY